MVITRGPGREDLAAVRAAAPAHVTVVASDEAFVDYRVRGAPFFVVAGPGMSSIATEGVPLGFDDVVAQVRRYLRGEGPEVPILRPSQPGRPDRPARSD